LMWAAGYSSEAGVEDIVETINLLLDHGARINDRDDRGRTALMIAAELDHMVVVDLLIRRGADVAARDKAGNTASDLAASEALKVKIISN
jgi:ankyrin repeat protein